VKLFENGISDIRLKLDKRYEVGICYKKINNRGCSKTSGFGQASFACPMEKPTGF
jgi:hypothetical protein